MANSFDDFDDFGDFGDTSSDLGNNSNYDDMAGGLNGSPEEFETSGVSEDKFEVSPIKLIIAGVIIVALIVISISIVKNVKANKENKSSSVTKTEDTQVVENEEVRESTDVNLREDVAPTSNVDYTEISGTDNIEFSDTQTELKFTVTGIKHYASTQGSELILKTALQGSLSGFAGTYELTVPYNKGTKLVVGDTFNVYVTLGKFKDFTVIGGIQY